MLSVPFLCAKMHLSRLLNIFRNSSNLYKALTAEAGKLSNMTNIQDEGKSFVHKQAASQIQLLVLKSAEMCHNG